MISALPSFLAYLATALLLLAGFLTLYSIALPMREWALIRAGNQAASLTLGGALIGFTLPLAESIRDSSSLIDMIMWAVIALVVQLLGFGAVRLWRRDAAAAIEAGDMAEAIILAAASIALGLINAACLTPS
jgi:putative membrane protein